MSAVPSASASHASTSFEGIFDWGPMLSQLEEAALAQQDLGALATRALLWLADAAPDEPLQMHSTVMAQGAQAIQAVRHEWIHTLETWRHAAGSQPLAASDPAGPLANPQDFSARFEKDNDRSLSHGAAQMLGAELGALGFRVAFGEKAEYAGRVTGALVGTASQLYTSSPVDDHRVAELRDDAGSLMCTGLLTAAVDPSRVALLGQLKLDRRGLPLQGSGRTGADPFSALITRVAMPAVESVFGKACDTLVQTGIHALAHLPLQTRIDGFVQDFRDGKPMLVLEGRMDAITNDDLPEFIHGVSKRLTIMEIESFMKDLSDPVRVAQFQRWRR